METLTIGQLAKSAGVNVETVRYYERRGLIPEPSRRASGYRQYTRDYAARIRFIKRAQELGFSLSEIAELLALRVGSDTVCSDVKQRAEVKIDNIEAKIQILKQMKQALVTLVAVCNENGITSECPILETLEGKGTL